MNKFKDTLTVSKLCNEYLAWNDKPRPCSTLRFGQYICNTYLKEDTSFSEIFYETDPIEAFHMILKELP